MFSVVLHSNTVGKRGVFLRENGCFFGVEGPPYGVSNLHWAGPRPKKWPKIDVWFLREKRNVLTFCSYGSSKGVIFTPSDNRIIHLLKVPYVPPGGPVERVYTSPRIPY